VPHPNEKHEFVSAMIHAWSVKDCRSAGVRRPRPAAGAAERSPSRSRTHRPQGSALRLCDEWLAEKSNLDADIHDHGLGRSGRGSRTQASEAAVVTARTFTNTLGHALRTSSHRVPSRAASIFGTLISWPSFMRARRCARGNPVPTTLEAWRRAGADIFRTDLCGAISMSVSAPPVTTLRCAMP
jgi:hypothetical protein